MRMLGAILSSFHFCYYVFMLSIEVFLHFRIFLLDVSGFDYCCFGVLYRPFSTKACQAPLGQC